MFRTVRSAVDRAGPHYIALSLAGVFGIIWPPDSLEKLTLTWVSVWFWLGSLIMGGILCSIGRWRHQTGPKLFGLALIIVAILTYCLALVDNLPTSGTTIGLLLSLTSLLAYRFGHTRRRRELAELASRGGDPGPNLVAYARDSLARRRDHRRRHRRGALASGEGETRQEPHTGGDLG